MGSYFLHFFTWLQLWEEQQCENRGSDWHYKGTEPLYLALQWGGVFNHMAGNLSIRAYAQVDGCVPSNCKQMPYWAHMCPTLTSKTESLSLCLDLAFFLCSFLLLFLWIIHPLCACIQNPQLLLHRGLRSSEFKWCKYRLPWGHHDTQGVCWLRQLDSMCECEGSG